MTRDHEALTVYLDGRLTMPFTWGRRANDCVSFGLGAVKAQTGRDLVRELRRAGFDVDWNTAIGAARVLRRLGGIAAAFDRVLPVIETGAALRGDLGLVEGEAGRLLVVVEGATVVGPGPAHAVRFPRSPLIRAWSLD